VSRWYEHSGHDDWRGIEGVAPGERALQYGDGLFETIAIRNGRPRLLELHQDRLGTGCDRLGIAAPDAGSLGAGIRQAIDDVAMVDGVVKVIVAAGPGARGYTRSNAPARVWIGVFDAGSRLDRNTGNGVRVRICTTRLAIQPALAGIKTLNRLEQVLARAEWREADAGVFEGLMLDTGGRLVCGTMSNVFIVHDQRYLTPPITRCGVTGVMRRHLMSCLAGAGDDVEVQDIGIDDAMAADELFLTNSQFGLLPVAACGERRWVPGARTRHAMQLLGRSGIVECRD